MIQIALPDVKQILDAEPQSSPRPLLCHFFLFSFLLPTFPKNIVIVLCDCYLWVCRVTDSERTDQKHLFKV